MKEKFFIFIPVSFQNNRISLGLFSLILFLTGCGKEKESCIVTAGMLVIEEDTIPKNNDYIIGKTFVENDSIAKTFHKDSVISKK